MAEEDDNLTEEQAKDLVRSFQEGKETTTSFFTKVVRSKDTTKTGNLTIEELGVSTHPVRTYQELALFCSDICEDQDFADFFTKMAEINLATSLSKDATLLRLVGTQRKEVADVTPFRKVNSGWFKKKDKNKGEEQ